MCWRGQRKGMLEPSWADGCSYHCGPPGSTHYVQRAGQQNPSCRHLSPIFHIKLERVLERGCRPSLLDSLGGWQDLSEGMAPFLCGCGTHLRTKSVPTEPDLGTTPGQLCPVSAPAWTNVCSDLSFQGQVQASISSPTRSGSTDPLKGPAGTS